MPLGWRELYMTGDSRRLEGVRRVLGRAGIECRCRGSSRLKPLEPRGRWPVGPVGDRVEAATTYYVYVRRGDLARAGHALAAARAEAAKPSQSEGQPL